jgi:hypothetical protein
MHARVERMITNHRIRLGTLRVSRVFPLCVHRMLNAICVTIFHFLNGFASKRLLPCRRRSHKLFNRLSQQFFAAKLQPLCLQLIADNLMLRLGLGTKNFRR